MSRAPENAVIPAPMRVIDVVREAHDTVSLTLEAPGFVAAPGQFCMIYAYGTGEIPVSISGHDVERGALVHTVRSVGAVSDAIARLAVGDVVFVRGPYGSAFPVHEAAPATRVFVAGGLGLAPLRPAIRASMADPGEVVLLVGARSPSELLFASDLALWRDAGVDVRVTVDSAPSGYAGAVGFVTALIEGLELDTGAHAFVCGPEIMMRASVRSLVARGLAPEHVHLSIERSMKCGVGLCGHCQLGPVFLCKDGPVLDAARLVPLLAVREL